VAEGGGLVLTGRPDAGQLDEPGWEWIQPIRDLCPIPVSSKDLWEEAEGARLQFTDSARGLAFLKLDEKGQGPLAGSDEFFAGRPGRRADAEERVRFWCCPVASVKPTATVLASAAPSRARSTQGKEQPCLVQWAYGQGRVVWLGLEDTYQLHLFKPAYYNRFWTGLARHAAAGSRPPRNVMILNGRLEADRTVELQARLYSSDGKPLPPSAQPTARIVPRAGGKSPLASVLLRAASPDQAGWFQGRLRLPQKGDYRVEILLPGSRELASEPLYVQAIPNRVAERQRALFDQLARCQSMLLDAARRLEQRNRPEDRKQEESLRKIIRQIMSLDWIPDMGMLPSEVARGWNDAEKMHDAVEKSQALSRKLQTVRELLDRHGQTYGLEGKREGLLDGEFGEQEKHLLQGLADAPRVAVSGLDGVQDRWRREAETIPPREATPEHLRAEVSAMAAKSVKRNATEVDYHCNSLQEDCDKYMRSLRNKGMSPEIDAVCARVYQNVRKGLSQGLPRVQHELEKLQQAAAAGKWERQDLERADQALERLSRLLATASDELDPRTVSRAAALLRKLEEGQRQQTAVLAKRKDRLEASLFDDALKDKKP
jgi:hypothetical protein